MRRLLIALLLALAVAGCAPVINWFARPDAGLAYAPGGILFDPGASVALAVVVDVQGDELESGDPRCSATPQGLDCRLGDVAAPTLIALSGRDVTAWASWRRENGALGSFVLAK